MKNLEELSRLHVEETIRNGLISQTIHRARSAHKDLTPPAYLRLSEWLNPKKTNRQNGLIMLLNRALKFVGYQGGKGRIGKDTQSTLDYKVREILP